MQIIALARKYGLKLTASSDYHGKVGEPGMETGEYGIVLAETGLVSRCTDKYLVTMHKTSYD